MLMPTLDVAIRETGEPRATGAGSAQRSARITGLLFPVRLRREAS